MTDPSSAAATITADQSEVFELLADPRTHAVLFPVTRIDTHSAVVFLAGLLLPVPFMLFGILIGLIQGYIFMILSAVFIGAAIESKAGELFRCGIGD